MDDKSHFILISVLLNILVSCCVVGQPALSTEVKPFTDSSLVKFHRQKELQHSVNLENVSIREFHDRLLRSVADFQDNIHKSDSSETNFKRSNVRHLTGVTDTTGRVNECHLDPLPVDLITNHGGSTRYGGPQQRIDGSIEFFGAKFALPRRQDGEAESQVETTARRYSPTNPRPVRGTPCGAQPVSTRPWRARSHACAQPRSLCLRAGLCFPATKECAGFIDPIMRPRRAVAGGVKSPARVPPVV